MTPRRIRHRLRVLPLPLLLAACGDPARTTDGASASTPHDAVTALAGGRVRVSSSLCASRGRAIVAPQVWRNAGEGLARSRPASAYPWELQPGVRKAALLPLASLDLLARAKSRAGQYTYTAPALNAELSNWFPPMPFALLSSRGAPTAMVLPSPDSATLEPKLSPPSLLDALT